MTWSTDASPGGRRDAGLFAFERASADETVLVVINTCGQRARARTCPDGGGACMGTSFAPGTVLTDVAPDSDGKSFTVAADGTVAVAVPARGGRLLVAQ